jgi:NADH:ubiquinone oxidoreductase subunit 6 (subunit J)
MIPKLDEIFKSNPVGPNNPNSPFIRNSGAQNFTNLGDLLSGLFEIVLYLAAFMTFYWIVWGAFQYIMASGKKEELAKARSKIGWAIIGLLVILIAYSITTYVGEFFKPGKGGLPFDN